ncbi:MAG: hypothetical protein V4685_16620 [Bacteroidota bacterium]
MRRHVPYILIVAFSIANGIIRYIVLDRWTWKDHIGSLLLQITTLVIIWNIVKALNRYFEKKLPAIYEKLVSQSELF